MHRDVGWEIPKSAISFVVLKHEGNMPFENDGLRGGGDGGMAGFSLPITKINGVG